MNYRIDRAGQARGAHSLCGLGFHGEVLSGKVIGQSLRRITRPAGARGANQIGQIQTTRVGLVRRDGGNWRARERFGAKLKVCLGFLHQLHQGAGAGQVLQQVRFVKQTGAAHRTVQSRCQQRCNRRLQMRPKRLSPEDSARTAGLAILNGTDGQCTSAQGDVFIGRCRLGHCAAACATERRDTQLPLQGFARRHADVMNDLLHIAHGAWCRD